MFIGILAVNVNTLTSPFTTGRSSIKMLDLFSLNQVADWVYPTVGPLLSYWIIPQSGIPISCTNVQNVPFLHHQTLPHKLLPTSRMCMMLTSTSITYKMLYSLTLPWRTIISSRTTNALLITTTSSLMLTHFHLMPPQTRACILAWNLNSLWQRLRNAQCNGPMTCVE